MSLNETPSGDRIHIGFFGRRNAGKSSVVNAVTGQDLSVVSERKGTTTDPVTKAMELLPLGPVVIIDTPGFDDSGELGDLRVRRTRQVLGRTDLAVLVEDATQKPGRWEKELVRLFEERHIPYLIARNKSDLLDPVPEAGPNEIFVSARTGENIRALRERLAAMERPSDEEAQMVGDLVHAGDIVMLVIPIDKAAPKGRLILPQQQVIRDLLDHGAFPICVRDTELAECLQRVTPSLVITDSQVFAAVARTVPEEIPLTSFSILMARKKGLLDAAVHGAAAISRLREGDRVLIAEGCTHHRQCGDIGSEKLPTMLRRFTGVQPGIELSSGRGFPDDLSPFRLVIHCGGCMLNGREVRTRMQMAGDQGVPITNFGTAIAFMNGILRRSLSLFPDLIGDLDGSGGGEG